MKIDKTVFTPETWPVEKFQELHDKWSSTSYSARLIRALCMEVVRLRTGLGDWSSEERLTFGYGKEVLEKAFNQIKDPTNWKLGRRNIMIETDKLPIFEAALIFYTGGGFETKRAVGSGTLTSISFLGYYEHIGA